MGGSSKSGGTDIAGRGRGDRDAAPRNEANREEEEPGRAFISRTRKSDYSRSRYPLDRWLFTNKAKAHSKSYQAQERIGSIVSGGLKGNRQGISAVGMRRVQSDVGLDHPSKCMYERVLSIPTNLFYQQN